MANLGTLWFDADLDLTKLEDKIKNGGREALKSMKLQLSDHSLEDIRSQIRGGLQNPFKVRFEADGTSIAEMKKRLQDELSSIKFSPSINGTDKLLSGVSTGNQSQDFASWAKEVQTVTASVRELVEQLQKMHTATTSVVKDGNTQGGIFDPQKFITLQEAIDKIIGEINRLQKAFTNLDENSSLSNLSKVIDGLAVTLSSLSNAIKIQPLDEQVKVLLERCEKAEAKLREVGDAARYLNERAGAKTQQKAANIAEITGIDDKATVSLEKYSKLLYDVENALYRLNNIRAAGGSKLLNQPIEQLEQMRKMLNELGVKGENGRIIDTLLSESDYAKIRELFNAIKTGYKDVASEADRYTKSKQNGAAATSHLSEEERKLASAIKSSTDSMRGQSQVLSDLKTMATQYLSIWGAQSFVNNIIQTGGLLEQQRMSIGAILGDLSQANHLFGQIQQLALKSPFGVVQLDTMSKQLTAYNFKYSELYDWTKRLADISAATGTEVSRLALALGHVRSEGALSGYTLRQFAMGNVPMLQTLATQLGKTTSEIRKMTREKAITYEDVEQALRTLTEEGGIFFNAQEVMSNALNAKFKNLHDAFDIMFGKMAESGVGDALKGLAETLTVLAKHWQEVGAQVVVVTGAFAAYKAVQATVNAGLLRSGVMSGQYSAKQLELLAATGKLNRELLLQAVAAGKVSAADAEAAGVTYNLTRAQLDAVAATGKTSAAFDVAAIAGGKYATSTQLLAAQFKSASWLSMTKWATGAKLAWAGLTGAIGAATTAVKGFLTTMWPLLAISAVTEVFMRMGQKSEELENYLKDLSQTANEATKNLGEVTKNFSIGSSAGKDSKQLTEDIEEMVEQLKSYSENSSETFKNAFAIDAEGKSVHSLAEQYEILAQALATAKKGYERLGEHSDIITNAIDSVDWQHERGKIMKFFGEMGKMVGSLFASDTYIAARGNLSDAIGNYVNKVREARIAENELLKDRISLIKALKAAGYDWADQMNDKTLIGTASNMPKMFKEADRAKVEGFWNAIGDSAEEALEKVRDSHAELDKAFALAGGKAQAAGTAIFKALSAEYGSNDVKKWPAEWRDEVMTALARVTAGVAGFADMSEEQQLRVRNAFMQPFGITLTLDNSEAVKRLTDMQIHLNEVVGKDWVVKLKLEKVGSFEDLYDQLDKTVKKSGETIKKLGDGISEERKRLISNPVLDPNLYDTLTDKEKEYRDAILNRNKAMETANKEGFKLSSLDKENKKNEQANKKAESAAEKAAKARTKQMEAQLKIEEELAKQRLELQDAIADAEVAAIENNAERERAQREAEFEKQKRQIEKQAEEWKKKAFELAKKEYEANPKNKTVSFFDTPTGKAGWQGISLTAEQEKILEANYKKLAAERQRYERELHEQQLKYMRDYLKEFGTVQQKRYAIQKEYDDKIAKEIDAEQRRLLEAQKKKALDALDLEVLKAEIDWTTMFDGIGNALEEEMKATLDKVEKLIQSKAFKGMDAKEQSEYVKLRNELYQKTGSGVGTFDFSIYHQIGEDLKAYQQAIKEAKIAMNEHENAQAQLTLAEKELTEADQRLKNATPKTWAEAQRQYQAALAKKDKAYSEVDRTGKAVKDAEGNVIITQGNLIRSTSAAEKAITDFGNAISEMTNGTLRGFADGLVNVINAIGGKAATGLKGISKTGGIIAAILSIIDAIGNNKEGLSGVVAEIIDKIINVITTIIDQITNGDFFRNINTAVGEGVQKLLEHLFNSIADIISNHVEAWRDAFNGNFGSGFQEGFGVGGFFGKIFGDRDDEKTYAEIQEEISDRIEEASKAIDRLTEQLDKSYGTDAIQKAEEAQKQLQNNQADMIKGLDAALWDNYGGGESDYRKWNRFGRDEGIIQRLMDKYGLKSSDISWNALFNENTADEIAHMLDDIRNTDFDLWSRFKSAGYNEGAVREWMEQLADTVKESDEIQKALEEKLTTTTKDNVIDQFKESLYDFADGSEDATEKIAENWQKMVNRMVIDNLVMKSMQADLEKWYADLVALQQERTNGEIDDKTYKERLATLKGNYEGIINSGRAMIDTFTKEGIIQPIEEAADKTKEYFEDLKGSWSSALADMTKTGKDWKNDLIDQVLDDLVESSVMQAPFDAMIDGAEKHFDTFALYLENWNERYKEIIEDTTLTDEKRTAKLKAMIDEQGTAYDKQSAKSKQLADGIGKDMTEAFSNSLDNLGDTLIDALLDTEKDAAQVSKEIGQTLAKEMLAEMLSAEKYANWKEDIRKMWQAILKGEDTEHTIDDVLGEITKLNEAIANDEDIDKVVKKYQEWSKAMEEASTSFGNLHDTVMDAILDMENGLDDFATDMNQKLVKDLIEKQVFSIPIDITWQDEAMHFTKGFDEYQKNWTQRYYDIYNDVTLSEEKREKLLQALVDEMIAQEQILNDAAQDLAKRTQKKKVDTTFTDMTDSFVSALMDMDGNLEDFANDMKKTIVQKLVEGFMVSNQIKPLQDDLQATFNYAIGLDGAEIKDRAAIINDGYTEILEDGTKVVHKGINELTDTLSPLKDKVKSVLEFIGYKFNETEDEIEENINDFTSTLNSALTSGETKASDFAKQLKEHIVDSLVEAYTATEEFQNGLNEVTDRLYHAIESGDELAITLAQQDAADFFDNATKAVEKYTKALDTASDQTKKFDGIFDGMASDMLSTLMDFNSTAEDWAEMLGKNISQKIANEIVSTAVITPIINELNTAMQDAIADSTLPDGSIDWTNLYGEGSPLMLYIKALEERFPQLKQTFMDLLKGFGVSMDEAAKEGFPDLTGTFVSALSDMDMTAEKFGRQIGKTMAEQMVKAYIDNKYGETMKDLNKRWFDALEKNDIGAIENIKKEIVDMYKTLANPEEEPELEGLLSAIREIEKQLDTTFSGMTDSWVSALMDMEGTADDFAKTVGKTMAQKILTDIIAPVYIQPLLNEMQEKFNAVISQVGATWQEAAAAMRPYLQQVKEVYYEVQPMVQELLGSFDFYKESVQEAAEEVEYALQDLKSNFVSSLMDMTSSAEDFSKEISKILAQNWIENYVLGAKFDQQMEYWQRQYESIIGSGMSEAERKRQLTALRDSIATAKQSYVNQAMAIQELLGITADSNEQQATMNMADKITYDQADQLLGVNIAQQLTLEQILATLQGGKVAPSAYTLGTGAGLTGNDEQSKLILANLQSMSAMMQDRQDAMLTQVAMANSYLQLIRDYNKRMCDQVELHMASMDNKLTSLRKL